MIKVSARRRSPTSMTSCTSRSSLLAAGSPSPDDGDGDGDGDDDGDEVVVEGVDVVGDVDAGVGIEGVVIVMGRRRRRAVERCVSMPVGRRSGPGHYVPYAQATSSRITAWGCWSRGRGCGS